VCVSWFAIVRNSAIAWGRASMADIFISYAKIDRNLVQQLAAHLEGQGQTTWWDTDVGAGQSSRSTIDQELESAYKVIVLWSKASIGSPFVLHEAITARDAGKLVQVKTSDIQVSDIPRPLRALPLLDATDLETIARAVSDDGEQANELPIETMLSKRRQLGRQGDDGLAVRSEAETTTARRPAVVDVPRTQVGRPTAVPSDPERTRVSSGPIGSGAPRPSAPRQSKRSGTPLIAIASALVAAVATAVAMQAGFLDGVFAKLLALLKLNVFPPVAVVGQPQETSEVVDCSVFAPPSAPAGKSMFVQVFLHAPEQLDRAEGIATKIDQGSRLRSIATLQTEVAGGQRLAITLDCLELAPDVAHKEIVWRGHPQAVSFRITIPQGTRHGQEFFPIVRVSIEGVPVGFLEFSIGCHDEPIGEADGSGKDARRYRYAFLSHASQDRKEVTKFARALSAAKIGFFQDILSLEPGDEWEERLFQEIDRCDVFYLFWSKHGAASEMVQREAEHAHRRASRSRAKIPDITPIRLDASSLPKHPPHSAWMEKIHFDDYFRKLIEAEGEGGR
jgi:hypothetical protein